jgi:hypothetical protein
MPLPEGTTEEYDHLEAPARAPESEVGTSRSRAGWFKIGWRGGGPSLVPRLVEKPRTDPMAALSREEVLAPGILITGAALLVLTWAEVTTAGGALSIWATGLAGLALVAAGAVWIAWVLRKAPEQTEERLLEDFD